MAFARLPEIAKEAFLLDVVGSEIVDTNELEGVASSKQEIIETAKEIQEFNLPKTKRMQNMIRRYLRLMDRKQSFPRSAEEIRKIYDELTEGEIDQGNLPDGRIFRKERSFVQNRHSLGGDTIHTGLHPEEEVILAIEKMLLFLSNSELNLLARVAIAHYYFGYTHPFYDGNGRAGRYLSSLLLSGNYHPLTAMSLARGCLLNRQAYLKAFRITNASESAGEMNYFVDAFLEILISGQEDGIVLLQEKDTMLSRAKGAGRKPKAQRCPLGRRCKTLFLIAQSHFFDFEPGITFAKLAEILGESEYPCEKRARMEDKYICYEKKRPTTYGLSVAFVQKSKETNGLTE